jgi:hypothetical protein
MFFQSFDFERTWWRSVQKHVVRTKFDIYSFSVVYGYCHFKKSLNITKRSLEAIHRRGRQYSREKKKDKRPNNDLQNITQQTKDQAT